MKKIVLLILLYFCTFVIKAQPVKTAKAKSDMIFEYYSKHTDTVSVGDSIIHMLHKDSWFTSLPENVQHGKEFRIHYYEAKTIGKYKKNKRYLHTWINRIYSTSIKK